MKIFISYRTDDTSDFVGRIHDKIANTQGVKKVFRDKNRIAPGATIGTEITSALNESEVFLIIIGEDWVGAESDDMTTEIQEEDDWVRMEVARALVLAEENEKKTVIPVLVEIDKIPSNDKLPEDLHPIQGKKWVHVRDNSFEQDMLILTRAVFGLKPPTYIREFFLQRPWLEMGLKAAGGFVFGLVTYFTVPQLLGFDSVADLLPGGSPEGTPLSAFIILILWPVMWSLITVNYWPKR